jgi:hypothetical protein
MERARKDSWIRFAGLIAAGTGTVAALLYLLTSAAAFR